MDELDVSDFKYGGVNLTGTADSAPGIADSAAGTANSAPPLQTPPLHCKLLPATVDSAAALLHDGLLHYGGVNLTGTADCAPGTVCTTDSSTRQPDRVQHHQHVVGEVPRGAARLDETQSQLLAGRASPAHGRPTSTHLHAVHGQINNNLGC